MKRWILITVCGLLGSLVAPPAGAQNSGSALEGKDKNQSIRELMQLTGAGNLGRQMMDQMRPSLEKAFPTLPVTFWDEFMAEVKAEELVDRIVPIYAEHFTTDDVNALIQFYKTPIGRKLVAETPGLMRECMAVGQEWGREVGERAYRKAETR